MFSLSDGEVEKLKKAVETLVISNDEKVSFSLSAANAKILCQMNSKNDSLSLQIFSIFFYIHST